MFAFASTSGGDLRWFILAADRLLAGFPDPLEIARVPTANADGVVDAIAEAVRQDGVARVWGRMRAGCPPPTSRTWSRPEGGRVGWVGLCWPSLAATVEEWGYSALMRA